MVHFTCQETLRQYLIARLQGDSFTVHLAELMKIDVSDGLDAEELRRLRELLKPEEADYDLGIDAFTADSSTFREKIQRMSQLPNLEMNFRRRDSLHDYISGVPLIVHHQYAHRFTSDIEHIHKKGLQLHRAKKAEQKRKLRLEILERRFEMSRQVLEAELLEWRKEQGLISDTLFSDETATRAEKRLASRVFDSQFYPKLRRLEGADFDSPFNFAWQIDFADIFASKEVKPVSTIRGEFPFVNEIDSQKSLLEPRREAGGFDIVVGNPPFVTARSREKRELWRQRWPSVCTKNYQMVCPFFALGLSLLLRPAGQLAFIVSNAFAKREFGKPLVEHFLPQFDIEKVIDCSGLMFPGHGTPTCIVFGRNQKPDSKNNLVVVAAILPGGGDLRSAPEESLLWWTLQEKHNQTGYHDSRVSVVARKRHELSKWPCARLPLWPFKALTAKLGRASFQQIALEDGNVARVPVRR